jgi:hypothetical protein
MRLGMKMEQKRTELSGATFVLYFYTETETNTKTPETNIEMDTFGNRHGTNTV